jgi:hypothetical protein
MRTCSVEGCEGKHIARGLCGKHYQSAKSSGDITNKDRIHFCLVEDCGAKYLANGLCQKHYHTLRRYGFLEKPEKPICTHQECSSCNTVKSINEFRKAYCKKRHKAYFRKNCKKCENDYDRSWSKTEAGILCRSRYAKSEPRKLSSSKYHQSEKGKSMQLWARFRYRDINLQRDRRRRQLEKLGPNFKPTNDAPINYTSISFLGDV